MSRLENAPSRTEIARMMGAMVDLFRASWKRAPASIILDLDDTFDAVHGKQQISLFNARTTMSAAFCPSISTKASAASRWR
jgi:Transposase DDE domain group 1